MSLEHRHTYRRESERFRLSGGVLRVPKTPAERLALYVKLRKLKSDFLRRQAR